MINIITCNTHPTGFLVHGLVVLASIALFVWWTKKKALISFRAWALFMTIVHVFYFLINCSSIREPLGLTMNDVFFVRALESLITIITMMRLYFIIEAHGIDITEKTGKRIDPVKRVAQSVSKAISVPENPEKINGYAKKLSKTGLCLKSKLKKLLF